MGFMVTFSIGGMTGVLLAVPGADFVLHNSLFLIAHFHNVIIGGAVFGYIAGFAFWFPKAFGFKLNENWARLRSGSGSRLLRRLHAAVRPGLHGHDPSSEPHRQPSGTVPVRRRRCGADPVRYRLPADPDVREVRDRNQNGRDRRPVEWPHPGMVDLVAAAVLQLRSLPEHDARRLHEAKENGVAYKAPAKYEPIHMPNNTATGVFMGLFLTVFGFALIWHIWWLAIAAWWHHRCLRSPRCT
jgi:cytochrome o ubiquinol oxidase subunit 1